MAPIRKLTKRFFKEQGRIGGKAVWADLSPEERSAEMERRAAWQKKKSRAGKVT